MTNTVIPIWNMGPYTKKIINIIRKRKQYHKIIIDPNRFLSKWRSLPFL